MSEHTPGPWEYDANDDAVYGPEADGFPFVMSTLNIKEPDARLIAAAPELLAALEHLMAQDNGPGCWTPEFESQVRAAIAKAKGGKP